jgi:hypothetical protein
MKVDEEPDEERFEDDRRGRPRVFTDMVLARIPLWIDDGWTLDAIAEKIGTTIGSLYATCSRLGISLKGAKRPASKREMDELVLRLPKPLLEKLDRRSLELSMSTEHLVIVLLEQIVGDNLFDAVLDFDGVGIK